MSYTANSAEYYYDGANDVDDGSDIDMEDDLLQLLGDAKRHSEEEEEDTNNNNNVGRDRRRRWWKKYLVSWCSEEGEEDANKRKRKRKRKRMGSYKYNEVQVLGSGTGTGGGCCWGTGVVVLGRALRNYKYNIDGTRGSPRPRPSPPGPPPPPPPYESMKLGVDANGGLMSSSSYYGPIYLVT